MRYTTVIDISEMPSLYKNINVRLLYLHMSLKAGYHEEDRDLLDTSIRRLAAETGLTMAATRHALKMLQQARLVMKEGPLYRVTKFCLTAAVPGRAKTKQQQKQLEVQKQRAAEHERAERERAESQKKLDEMRQNGKTSYMIYFENLLKKAAEGDAEAIKITTNGTRRRMYENHCQAVREQQTKSERI